MGELGFRVDAIGSDREIVGDVVEDDVDLIQGHARALVVREAIERELQHPSAPVDRGPGWSAGLPVDDLDPSAAVLATIDRIQLADDLFNTIRAAQRHVDLGLDLKRRELGPFRLQERLLQSA